jgi:uncharacterized protein YecE (DUF72 family)
MTPAPAPPPLRLGTAGWAIPRAHAAAFPAEGSSLARYAARLGAAEINSSFHRPHRRATYERWAAAVPDGFRFAVKLPKTITHERRLLDTAAPLERFLGEAAGLGAKLGPLLVQLPPSLAFDPAVAEGFFALLRQRHAGLVACEASVACEPRHPSWFTPEADSLLVAARVARVAADPARVPEAAEPGGWNGLVYHRLHGSPRMYRSAYEPPVLAALAERLAGRRAEAWCVFDNTASGAALGDALELGRLLDA